MRDRERAELLQLLNGNQVALRRIEGAVSRFKQMLPIEVARKKAPTEVAKDAKRLHDAIQTIAGLVRNKGDVWATFREHCFSDGKIGVDALLHLEEAFIPGAGEPGDTLAFAASMTADELKPTRGASFSVKKEERLNLLHHAVNAARDAGLKFTRHSAESNEFVRLVYLAAGIDVDHDNDVRDYMHHLKTLEQAAGN
jgi:hypothetical protein